MRRSLVSTILLALALAGPARATEAHFSYTGAEQTFTVPAFVTQIHVVAIGGTGADGGGTGGGGAKVVADIPVTPGQVLYLEVGGNGNSTAGGFNGGADAGGNGAGGGGGATDLRTCPALGPCADSLGSRLLVAGGGGGGGEQSIAIGADPAGAGGVASGLTGGAGAENTTATGGGGGTQSAGGAGGFDKNPDGGVRTGDAGTAGAGGHGGPVTTPGIPGGGGGGGGLFGGGGGGGSHNSNFSGAGGGAGSSYVEAMGSGISFATDATKTPSIDISYGPTALAVTPAGGLTFSGTAGTATPAQAVKVENTGASPMTVQSVALAGGDASQFSIAGNGCNTPVPPQASCLVDVVFAPTAPGARSASLQVAANAPESPQGVPLAGTAAASPGNGGPGPTGGGALKVGKVTVVGTKAKVTLTCEAANGACTAALVLRSTVTTRGKQVVGVAAKAKLKRRQVTVGNVTAVLVARTPKLVTVSLNRAGRKLLRGRRALPATLVVSQVPASGRATEVSKQKLKFKARR